MRNKGKLFALSILVAGAAVATASATAAWFQTSVLVEPDSSLTGRSKGAYFGGGDGSEDHPYIITNKNHVYNLAWLYYLGYFDGQTPYFRVDADVAMEGLVIPPIGTSAHPFLGYFDGQGHTISGFKSSNQIGTGQIELKPVTVTASNFVAPNIIGFFGVVGPLGTSGYTPDAENVCDVTINNYTAESASGAVLIGLAAGYVNGLLSGVQVTGSSAIKVSGATPLDSTTYTENISDYGLVGYTEKTAIASEYVKEISNRVYKTTPGQTSGGFGASVNFKDYVDWFYSLHVNNQYSAGRMRTQSNDNTKTGTNYNLTYRLLTAGQNSDPECDFNIVYTTNATTSYAFSFNQSGSSYSGTYREFTSSSATEPLTFTATSTTRSGKTAYILTFASTVSRFGQSKFDLLQQSSGSTTYFAVKTGSTSVSSSTKVFSYGFVYANNHVYQFRDGNYIPLKFSDNTNSAVDDENTGYIIGTNYSNTSSNNAGSPRIAAYSTSYLSNSMSNGLISSVNTYHNGAWTTITDTKDNGVVVSSSIAYERYISSRNAVATAIEGKRVVSGIHFDVHASDTYSGGGLRGSIQEGAYVEKTILKKSYGGTAKETRMPLASVNFELEKAGYINFFAGTYSVTSGAKNNFFSLHHVIRTGPKAYTLKEIKKIYYASDHSDSNPHYVYEYNTNPATYSDGTISGSAIFDFSVTMWPARSTANENKLYYFEFPVNQGEYAMGAVDKANSGGTAYQGAYLIYLDIGSNGQSSGDNRMDVYSVKTVATSDIYPGGVDFGITGITTVGGSTVALAITYDSSAVTGQIAFTVGSVVNINAGIASEYKYIRSNAVYNDSSSTVSPGALSGSSGEGTRIIRAHIVDYQDVEWQIVLEQELDDTGAVTSSSYTTITAGGVNKTVSDLPAIFTGILDANGAITGAVTAVTLSFIGTDFSCTATYTGADYKKVEISIPTVELGSTVVDVDITSGYSASINGTDVVDGGVYPTT